MACAMHGSDGPWSSQDPRRKEKHGAQEREDTVDGNSHDAEGQRDQPNERVEDECEERYRPAKEEQNAPE
jgi:hypothetical protein